MPRRAVLLVASASALLAPQTRVTQTRRHSTTLNPLEQLAEQAQIKAYEASAAAIAATISAKVAEKGDRMPDGMVPIVQEFMRTYLDVVAKQKRDPMEKVPVLKEYLGLVEDQLDEPFVFALTTKRGRRKTGHRSTISRWTRRSWSPCWIPTTRYCSGASVSRTSKLY